MCTEDSTDNKKKDKTEENKDFPANPKLHCFLHFSWRFKSRVHGNNMKKRFGANIFKNVCRNSQRPNFLGPKKLSSS